VTRSDTTRILDWARDRLATTGFRLATERQLGSSGDRLVEFRHASLIVEISLDRGQVFLTMRTAAGVGDHDLGLWEACLDGREPSTDARDLSADLDFLAARLADLERLAAEGGDALADCLRTAGRRRFSARRDLGLTSRGPGVSEV